MPVIAYHAQRGDGNIGYFRTREEVPHDWYYLGEQDIQPVMDSMRCNDADRVLEIMNQHWKDPVLGPRCLETKVIDETG